MGQESQGPLHVGGGVVGGRADEEGWVAISSQDLGKIVFFLPQVVLSADDVLC